MTARWQRADTAAGGQVRRVVAHTEQASSDLLRAVEQIVKGARKVLSTDELERSRASIASLVSLAGIVSLLK
jgi:hypothetical protein